MAEEQQGRKPSAWRTSLGLILVVLPVLGGCVALLILLEQDTDDTVVELNDRYVEQVEIESVPRAGSGYRDVLVIDGARREDCDEDDAVLTCSEDPQPTEE